MGDLLPSCEPDVRSGFRADFERVREACRQASIYVPAKVFNVLQAAMSGIVAIGSLEEPLLRTADVEKTRDAAVARAEVAQRNVGELEKHVSQAEAALESDKDRPHGWFAAANEKLEQVESRASDLEAFLIAVQQKLISLRDVQRGIFDFSQRALMRKENRMTIAKGMGEQVRGEADTWRVHVAPVKKEREPLAYERDGALALASLSKKKEDDIVSKLCKVREYLSLPRQQMAESHN